jgi:hypothetical protein
MDILIDFLCSVMYLQMKKHQVSLMYFHGVPGTTRTCDLQFRKLMLYPTELQAQLLLLSEISSVLERITLVSF